MTTNLSLQPGTGPRWDVRGRRWWWSGQDAAAVYAYSPQDKSTITCRLPDSAGLLAHCRSGRLLLGLPKRLCLAEVDKVDTPGVRPLRMQPLAAVDAAEPRTSISDGCTDRRGFLVFGTSNVGADRRPIGSFIFNVGSGAFAKGLLPHINARRHERATTRILRYVTGRDVRTGERRVLRGLLKRRRAEVALYKNPLPLRYLRRAVTRKAAGIIPVVRPWEART